MIEMIVRIVGVWGRWWSSCAHLELHRVLGSFLVLASREIQVQAVEMVVRVSGVMQCTEDIGDEMLVNECRCK